MMMAHLLDGENDTESEVARVFQQRTGVQPAIASALLQPNSTVKGANTTQYIIEMDRSDDEESDHTSDPYASSMRGRVSPSPYTANTERARQFNSYVRSIIEQKLDIFVPISHQPRDLVSDIIADVSGKFPEFASCARKRIRTFLKSYRRSKKLKEGSSPSTNGVSKMDDGPLNSLPGVISHSPHSHPLSNPSPEVQSSTTTNNPPSTAVVTIIADGPQQLTDDGLPPDAKRMKLTSLPPAKPPVFPGLTAAAAASNSQSLSISEVQAVKQLITGYRESAAFLQRAADQLEAMLQNNSTQSSV